MIRKRVTTDGAFGFTMVEMAIVMLIIVIVATVIIPPTLKLGSTSRLRSGGMSAYSFIRGARSAAISEGLTLHVRYLNGATGPMLEAIHVNPAQPNRFTNPDFSEVKVVCNNCATVYDSTLNLTCPNCGAPKANSSPMASRFDSILLQPDLQWNTTGYFYFRPDGSTLSSTITLTLEKKNDPKRKDAFGKDIGKYAEIQIYPGSGIVEMNRIHDE